LRKIEFFTALLDPDSKSVGIHPANFIIQ